MSIQTTCILLLTLLFSACQNSGPDFEPLTMKELKTYKDLGGRISGTLVLGLKSELMEVMKAGGPSVALSHCNLRALSMTDSLALKEEVTIRRVSKKLRNPLNFADRADMRALDICESHLGMSEDLPSEIMQKFHRGNREIIRYYRPLRVAKPCLNCHGNPDHFAPGLAEKLAQLYPGDQATGYSAGDFRGLIRVEFTLPESEKL